MSSNRGIKRNAFGNRNFNRGSGGGGGGGGGNVGPGGVGMGGAGGGGGGGGSRGGMNPWESGIMPGRGILPTPSNNLSLNSPQAQLVIASNLLSNLLRTQQDTQPQVPSLLSLSNNMNGPGSNFRGQQNFSQGRFNDRQMRPNVKNQRPQPYNKMGNRVRDAVAGRRGPSAQQSRAQSQSGNQRINGNQNQHRNDKTSKPNPASKQNQTIKKEPQDVKTSDNEKADAQPIAKSEENEVTEVDNVTDKNEEKREDDATAEDATDTAQFTGESIQVPTDEGTTNAMANAAASNPKKSDDNQLSGKKSEARHAESRYAAVPISHMFCHVCTKHMWDGFSFENHLRGRAHQLMMEKLDESYKLRVDFMRHELKVSEEQRELSLHNSKRRGKKVSVDLSVREYCPMCDLNFYGTLSSHRKSEKHQQLKSFLHPRCIPCAKEFPTRIEYDEHCLTPSHMSNVAQNEEQKKTKKNKLAKGESEVRTADDEEKDTGSDPKSNEKEEELPENTEYLLDINDDMNNEKYKVPSFKYCRQNQIALGESLVKQVQGYHCDKCRRFMLTEEDMNLHLRTLTHYRNFVAEVKAQTAPVVPEPNAEKETEGNDSKQQGDDADDGGDPKRRKIESQPENESTPTIKTEPLNTTLPEDTSDAGKKVDGDEIYDPLEADADSEEDENKANVNKNDSAMKEEIKNEPSMEVWGDGDNDNEPEVGNLLDDEDVQMEVQPSIQSQTPTSQSPVATTQPQTPTAQSKTSSIQQQTPTATPQTPTTQSQTPITQPQTPITESKPSTPQSQTPTTQSQTPTIQPKTPTTQPQSPIAQSQTPAAQPQTPITQTKTPSTQPQTPSTQPQTPVIEPKTPVAQPQTPATQLKTPTSQPQTPSTPLKTPIPQPQTPSTPLKTPIPQSQTPTTQPKTPVTQPQSQNKYQPQSQPQQQQQLQSTLTVDVNQMGKKNNSPMQGNNMNAQGKLSRGRGFRGRGHQRARRSRR